MNDEFTTIGDLVDHVKISLCENGKCDVVAVAQFSLSFGVYRFHVTGVKMFISLKDGVERRYIKYQKNLANKRKYPYFFPISKEGGDVISNALWSEYDKATAK